MFNVLNCRSEENSLFKIGIFTNKKLLLAILVSLLLQIAVIETPLRHVFHTMHLTFFDWLYAVLIASSVLIFGELWKIVFKIKHGNSNNR